MVYDSAHSQVVLFGGTDSSGNLLNDTWVWDGSNWTQKSPANAPPPRSSFAMAYDSASNQTVLFGGYAGSRNGVAQYFADTWIWDGANWTQESPPASPPGGNGISIGYDSAHSEVVLEIANPQTWVWDGVNWTRVYPQPSPASFGSMTYDAATSNLALFDDGGQTWVWDGVNWTQESPQSTPPPGGLLAYDSEVGQIVLFGGVDENLKARNETWWWDGTNWTQQRPPASPPARESFAMAYDSGHNQVVLFGGGVTADLHDTWTYGVGPSAITFPAISNVISASAFGAFSSVAPGSWVEIYGSYLAPSTESWTGADFTANEAPTMFNGVSVNIGGQAAFVDYISATQVNAQLPSNIATGATLQLTVTNGTLPSAPVNVTVNTTEPGLLAPAGFQIGGNQYVVAQHSDGSYVLPVGAIAGVKSRPAQPGETVVVYGVGFGSVVPNIPAGEIAAQTNQLSASLQVLFGQTPAELPYFGLAPNFVGLYQFNITVPAIPNDDLVPLTFNLGGVTGTQALFTAVHE
jgi:uncharacterized protein (TIGR03437 family)